MVPSLEGTLEEDRVSWRWNSLKGIVIYEGAKPSVSPPNRCAQGAPIIRRGEAVKSIDINKEIALCLSRFFADFKGTKNLSNKEGRIPSEKPLAEFSAIEERADDIYWEFHREVEKICDEDLNKTT